MPDVLLRGVPYNANGGDVQLGSDAFDPKLRGGLSQSRVDYTRLGQTPFLNGLLFWSPLQDAGLEQSQILRFPEFSQYNGYTPKLKWANENQGAFGPRRRERCSRIEDPLNTLDLGFDIFSKRPVRGTVSFWIRFFAPDTVDLLAFRFGSVADGVLFGITADGRLQMLYTMSNVIVVYSVGLLTGVTDQRWHHCAYTGSKEDGAPWRMFVDGIEQPLLDLVGTNVGHWFSEIAIDTSNAAFIDQNSVLSAHGVEIADVGSWDRVLTDGEILTLAKDPDAIYARSRRVLLADPTKSVSPTGIPTAEAFGTPRINQQIAVTGIPTAEAFGTPSLNQQIRPTAIASAEAFGTARLNQQIVPSGVATAEVFGTPTLKLAILPTGVASVEAFGTPTLRTLITPTGIASAEAFGTALLHQQIRALAIASAEAFGTPSLQPLILPVGIATAEAFGVPSLLQVVLAQGIASDEALGSAFLHQQIRPDGVPSAEAFGVPSFPGVVQTLLVVGIASAEAFGLPLVTNVYIVAISDFTGERLSVITMTGERRVEVPFAGERRWLHLLGGERRVIVPHSGERRLIKDLDGDKT